ncbi:hypothetical protein ABFS83_05G132300 [Erythranthe nasuta]
MSINLNHVIISQNPKPGFFPSLYQVQLKGFLLHSFNKIINKIICRQKRKNLQGWMIITAEYFSQQEMEIGRPRFETAFLRFLIASSRFFQAFQWKRQLLVFPIIC